MKKINSSIVLYTIVLSLLLALPVLAKELPPWNPCSGGWSCLWENPEWYGTGTGIAQTPFEKHRENACKNMRSIVLHYLENTKGDDVEDVLNAVKANTYSRIYIEGCNPTSTYRQRDLMMDVLRIEGIRE